MSMITCLVKIMMLYISVLILRRSSWGGQVANTLPESVLEEFGQSIYESLEAISTQTDEKIENSLLKWKAIPSYVSIKIDSTISRIPNIYIDDSQAIPGSTMRVVSNFVLKVPYINRNGRLQIVETAYKSPATILSLATPTDSNKNVDVSLTGKEMNSGNLTTYILKFVDV